MAEINGTLDNTLRYLENEEGRTLRREHGQVNKNKQDI